MVVYIILLRTSQSSTVHHDRFESAHMGCHIDELFNKLLFKVPAYLDKTSQKKAHKLSCIAYTIPIPIPSDHQLATIQYSS